MTDPMELVVNALTSEDEIAHGEAYSETRGLLGVCAYCDGDWPCRTQQGINRLLSQIAVHAAASPGARHDVPGAGETITVPDMGQQTASMGGPDR